MKSFVSKMSIIIPVIAGALMMFLIGYLGIVDNVQVFREREDLDYVQIKDYSCKEVRNKEAPIGIQKEYRFKISETLRDDTYFAFYTVHQYVKVYLNGQLVYSLGTSEENKIGRTVGSNWVMIPLCREDTGKEIYVEIQPVYESFRDRKIDFLVGSQLGIYRNRLSQDLPQLILGTIAVFVGIVFICVAGYSIFKRKKGGNLAALGLFSVMMGIWRLTDTRFTPFIIPEKPVFLFYVSIAMLMLGMIPLIKSMEEQFHKISCLIFDCCCIGTSVICLIQLLIQILGIVDLRDNLYITHIAIAISAVIVITNVLYDKLRFPQKRGSHVGRKFPIICVVGVIADIGMFYVKGTSSGLIFSLIAFLLYIVFTGIKMLLDYGEQEKKLKEQEKLLAESKISIMMSQIQPHFVYNTLSTISQLCLKEPQRASELVQDFSLYLRGNFSQLDNHAPIYLSQEIEHVKHYVSIEHIRFPDMQIEFDLNSGEFLLPALSIQPLVENAIKHGLMGLESGGTVIISTYETDREYCVCVKDDGVGFKESVWKDGRKHIGIQNIRGRLEAMCGGDLVVNSTPGVGTTALITIPKNSVE